MSDIKASMNEQREKVTVSFYGEELIALERLKKEFCDQDLSLVASTSEILRVALKMFVHASLEERQNAIAQVKERRPGRPKRQNYQ
jgi:hypothetical protein